MTRTEINNLYFDWMHSLVMDGAPREIRRLSYRKLLELLRDLEFYYTIPMDGNRLEDGIELRYRFGRAHSIEDPVIATCIDDRTCSMLEMMIALAIRCEESFMVSPDAENRTSEWFWVMIRSLGLEHMNDKNFDQEYIEGVVTRFLEHDYDPDGNGGLFYIENCSRDLRNVEIWYQLNWYLSHYYNF